MPAFLLSGTPQSAWSFTPFFLGVVALAMILTPMFNTSRGSLFIAALYDFQMNSPAWPAVQPWDIALFLIVAVIVVVPDGGRMLSRAGTVTEVLMPGDEAVSRTVTATAER